MKKKLLFLLSMMLVISLLCFAIVRIAGKSDKRQADKKTIVTSFYPMYILTKNVVLGASDITVENMTENQTGCLHDYQLTTKDMVKIFNADVYVMSGNGMESFLEEVVEAYPKLKVVVAGEGIELLESEGHDHDHDEHDHDHDTEEVHAHEGHNHDHDHEENGHVWMDTDRYITEITNVADSFSRLFPEHAELFSANAETYIEKVRGTKEHFDLSKLAEENIIIFHEAFEYLAASLNMNTVHAVEMDSETSLSAGELAAIVEEIKDKNVHYIFTEAQFSTAIPDAVAREAGVEVVVIDSLVTGDGAEDSYIRGMKENFRVLSELTK